MNKRYILMLLLLIQSFTMWAQLEIKGRVLDAETGETLSYALPAFIMFFTILSSSE